MLINIETVNIVLLQQVCRVDTAKLRQKSSLVPEVLYAG